MVIASMKELFIQTWTLAALQKISVTRSSTEASFDMFLGDHRTHFACQQEHGCHEWEVSKLPHGVNDFFDVEVVANSHSGCTDVTVQAAKSTPKWALILAEL